MIRFFKAVINEIKKVSWLTLYEAINKTAIVLIFVLLITSLVHLFDLGITGILRGLINE